MPRHRPWLPLADRPLRERTVGDHIVAACRMGVNNSRLASIVSARLLIYLEFAHREVTVHVPGGQNEDKKDVAGAAATAVGNQDTPAVASVGVR